jgi:rsbT antagonist protein RsbS
MQDHNIPRIPLQLVSDCVVASIQVDLSEDVLAQFRTDLLAMLQRTSAASVILDVSGVEIMDLVEFEALRQTVSMARLMGARTIFSGFRAGVVSALVELDAEVGSIDAALNLDAAFVALEAESEVGLETVDGIDEESLADAADTARAPNDD